MNMKTHLASLVVVLASSGSLMSATETDRLRALCAEQEMQIRQLEEKIAQLTDTPPPSRPAPSVPSAPAESSDAKTASQESTYTVKSGDSIERIARNHGTTAYALSKLNGLKDGSLIHPGQKLKVPGKTAVAGSQPAPAKESRTHTVSAGETFFKISMKYGVTVDELIAANPSVNHKSLRVGQKIKVDRTSTAVAKAPAPAPKPTPSLASSPSIPILNNPAPVEKPRTSDRPILIEKEITYGQFAAKHGTTTRRLDELNGLELDPSTVLAKGSELYIPAQP